MNDNLETIQSLVLSLCSGLVSDPQRLSVEVKRSRLTKHITAEVLCAPGDFSRILGASAANLNAIKLILDSAGGLMEEQITLTLPSPNSEQRSKPSDFTPNLNWKPAQMLSRIEEVCDAVFVGGAEIEVVSLKQSTRFEIGVDESERHHGVPVDKLFEAIRRIFRAHGKNQGRDVDLGFTEGVEGV